jgi:predicted transcriptional regulator
LQLERGIPEEQIHKLFDLDTEFDVGFQVYVDFALENNWIVKDKETGKYTITSYGKEFINLVLNED